MTWQSMALASAFFAALTVVFAKIGVRELDANLATFIRTLVILALTSSIVSAQGSWRALPNLDVRPVMFLVLSGLATGASWLFYFHALKLGPASRVAPLDKLSVPFAVLLAVLFLHETLTWKIALGIILMTLGALLLV